MMSALFISNPVWNGDYSIIFQVTIIIAEAKSDNSFI